MVNFTGNTCIWIYFMDVNGCKWYISEEKHHRWWLRKCSVSCYLSHKADGQVMENHWFKVTSATGYFNDGSSLKPPNYRLYFFRYFPMILHFFQGEDRLYFQKAWVAFGNPILARRNRCFNWKRLSSESIMGACFFPDSMRQIPSFNHSFIHQITTHLSKACLNHQYMVGGFLKWE